jgi:uncharacterized protein YgiM (DUF1202 family)
VLAMVVYNWYGDFKSASVVAAANRTTATTQTINPASQVATGSIVTVTQNGLNFRVKPASSAKLIRGMKKGDKMTLLAKEGQWYKVKDSKGKTGWITATSGYYAIQAK